jgi:hypothetical protein
VVEEEQDGLEHVVTTLQHPTIKNKNTLGI